MYGRHLEGRGGRGHTPGCDQCTVVALLTKTSVVVANLGLDSTQTSSPDRKWGPNFFPISSPAFLQQESWTKGPLGTTLISLPAPLPRSPPPLPSPALLHSPTPLPPPLPIYWPTHTTAWEEGVMFNLLRLHGLGRKYGPDNVSWVFCPTKVWVMYMNHMSNYIHSAWWVQHTVWLQAQNLITQAKADSITKSICHNSNILSIQEGLWWHGSRNPLSSRPGPPHIWMWVDCSVYCPKSWW